MLNWRLKKVKDFILKSTISGSFLSEKEFSNLYTMIIIYFPSGGCVDEVVDNRTNYQGYKYVLFPSVSHIDSHQFH